MLALGAADARIKQLHAAEAQRWLRLAELKRSSVPPQSGRTGRWLVKGGATEVVPEVLEGSLMLATHSLLLLGVPLNRVLKRIRVIREERYSLFRGFYRGVSDAGDAAESLQPRLHSVLLPDRAGAIGRSLADIELADLVEGTGVRR